MKFIGYYPPGFYGDSFVQLLYKMYIIYQCYTYNIYKILSKFLQKDLLPH